MNKKIVINTKIFTIIFFIMTVLSAFIGIKVYSELTPFSLIDVPKNKISY